MPLITNAQLEKIFQLQPLIDSDFIYALNKEYEYTITMEDIVFLDKDEFDEMEGEILSITVLRRPFQYKTTHKCNRLNFYFLHIGV